MGAVKQFQFTEYWQTCIRCGVYFGMDASLDQRRRQDKTDFFCPNGHAQVYSESDADRLRKELAAEKSRVELERSMRITAEEQLDKAKKEAKRVAKRIAAGVCPHCHRTFQQLARHMQTKHSEICNHE